MFPDGTTIPYNALDARRNPAYGKGVISQVTKDEQPYNSPFYDYTADPCYSPNLPSKDCNYYSEWYDYTENIYFNYSYDAVYQRTFGKQYLRQRVGNQIYSSPFYIRANDIYYRSSGINPYYDTKRKVYTNFTGDPYYSNFFNLNWK